MNLFSAILYLVLGPIVGGLLAGVDRKITARMQSRIGPPIVQPFYDVAKLFQKENLVVRRSQNLYVEFFVLFIILTGCLFFAGGDLLLVIFALTLAGVFFVLAGFKSSSPYSFIGANRELIQMMAYEPAVLLAAVGMYMVTKSFQVVDIVNYPRNLIIYLPGVFAAFFFILTIKFRKSPFDLATSHHAHQELVKGITTEFSGKTLGIIEIAHWYEYVFLLGFVYLFFAANPVVGVIVALFVFFLEMLIDNSTARVRWQLLLTSAWLVPLVLSCGNIIVLMFLKR